MGSISDLIKDYGRLVRQGDILLAYQNIMRRMRALRVGIQKDFPEFNVAAQLYQGEMDVSYFTMAPDFLKDRGLKLGLVFVHEKSAFELWLWAKNKKVQEDYRQRLAKKDLTPFTISSDQWWVRSIIEWPILEDPSFDQSDKLMCDVEVAIINFLEALDKILD